MDLVLEDIYNNAKKNWYPIRQQGRGYVFTETPILELNNEIESKYDNERNIDLKEKIEDIILNFGKYKGQTLTEIYQNDRGYIKFLSDKANDANLKNICKQMLAS